MDEKKRLLKNTVIISIGSITTKILSFFLIPFYTYILTIRNMVYTIIYVRLELVLSRLCLCLWMSLCFAS